ncbi:MAG TPA: mandelate racemase/muconate lactonizing enzyme family protein [Acidothermaceae bacterium]|jgi:L-alanine-DL-glutamate epimerase-like enolase superfamily enzyme
MTQATAELTVVEHSTFALSGRRTESAWGEDVHAQESEQTVVRLVAADGTVGVGAAYTSKALVDASLALMWPWMRNQSAVDPEGVTEMLHQTAYWQGRGGAVTTTISAVNLALWDIFGKVCNQPVSVLLGGNYRTSVRPYASLAFGDPADLTRRVQAVLADGFRAIKLGWHPFGRVDPATDEAMIRSVRRAIGDDIDLMVDAGGSEPFWPHRVAWARRTANMLAEYGVEWFEEPLSPDDLEGYRLLRRVSPVKIAGGETLTRRQSFRPLFSPKAIDIVQPDTTKVGGLSEARRIGWSALDHGVDYVPHGFNNAIGLAADVQLSAALPNCSRIEFITEAAYMDDLICDPFRMSSDGTLAVPDRPGLGIELDPDAIAHYSKAQG